MMVTLVGCSDDSEGTETPLSDKYSNISEKETDVFESTAAIFGNGKKTIDASDGSIKDTMKEGDKVRVSGVITPRILFLPKDHSRYDEFYKMLILDNTKTVDDMKMFKITVYDVSEDGMFPVIDVEKLSQEREREIRSERAKDKEIFEKKL